MGEAKEKVKAPGILLMVSGIINALLGVIGGVSMPVIFFGMRGEIEKELANDPEMTPEIMDFVINMYGYGGIGFAVLSVLIGIVVVVGALRMLSLRSWGLAMFAAILSVIPCLQSCCLLSLPVGIYAIVVLNDSGVRAAFKT